MKRKGLKPPKVDIDFNIDEEEDVELNYAIPLKIKKHRDKITIRKKGLREKNNSKGLF